MRRSFTLSTATALISALLIVACSSTPTQRSAGETVDDATLTGKVKAALVDNDLVKAGEVNVDSYRGVVQLNGFVGTQAEKSAASKAAQSVKGVKEVRNNLEVKSVAMANADADRSAGQVVDDATITAKVKTALIEDKTTKAHQINVDTSSGIVELGGFVDSQEAKDRAGEVARSVKGVKDVKNDLQLKPKP
ncbi:MAG TPA: BON domain-containing protein [Steroidobacteraceae bacterium]|nr:BON domain-containing protein [Steroidobacteraceae bacterium]